MSEKTLPPTKKRLDKARREGQVCKSQFLTQILVLTTGILTLIAGMRFIWLAPGLLVKFCYTGGFEDSANTLKGAIFIALGGGVIFLIPCALVGAAVESAQLGFRILIGSGFQKTGRLSVVSGVKRMWSGVTTLWLQLFLITSLCVVLYRFLDHSVFTFAKMVLHGNLHPAAAVFQRGVMVLIVWMVLATGVEYWIRRRQHAKTLLMDHDELKREMKEGEGDPMIRGQRKALHQALMMQNLERRVRRAKLVIVERTKRPL